MGVWLAIAKPIVVIWAGLNAIDDLSLLFRFARLGSVLVPGLSSLQPHMMCDVCDDVMGDLLKGPDGHEALPRGASGDATRENGRSCREETDSDKAAWTRQDESNQWNIVVDYMASTC